MSTRDLPTLDNARTNSESIARTLSRLGDAMTTTRPARPTNDIRRFRMTRNAMRRRLATDEFRRPGNTQHFVVSYGRTHRLPSNERTGTCNLRLGRPQECDAGSRQALSLTRRNPIEGLTGWIPDDIPISVLIHLTLTNFHAKQSRPAPPRPAPPSSSAFSLEIHPSASTTSKPLRGNDSFSPDRQHQSQEHDDSESEDAFLLYGPLAVHNSFPGIRGCPNGNQQQALQR